MTKPKERSPAMQFYFRQFEGDEHVMSMDLDAVGAHILLMCAAGASEHGYKLAYDERALRVRLRNPSDPDFSRIMSQLLAGAWKVSDDGKWLVQYGQRRTLLKQKEFSAKQKANVEKRWVCQEDTKRDTKRVPNPCSSSSSLSTSTTTDLNTNTPLAIAQVPAPKVKPEVLAVTGKTLRAKYVWLSDIELEQFTVTHGPEFIKRCIEKLDAWIETDPVPKRIKNGRNAGACFRSWVFNSVAEEQTRASRGKAQLGFKPHTAASTVEKNEQYLKDRYGQGFVDQMLASPGIGEAELDFKPASGSSVELLPQRNKRW